MVAANSGLPGGQFGNQFVSNELKIRADEIHPNYRPQEEDVVSAWLNSLNKSNRDAMFKSNLFKRWGLIEPIKKGYDEEYDTFQGINYNAIDTIQDMEKYGDAWVVKDVSLSCKTICGYTNKERKLRPKFKFTTNKLDHADLFFVAAPNSNKGNEPHGSMARTLNTFSRDYISDGTYSNKAHIEGVKAASRAVLDAMIEEGIAHAFLVGIGAGVYYNNDRWTEKLDIKRIFNEILKEDIGQPDPHDPHGKKAKRGQFFKQVYYITL